MSGARCFLVAALVAVLALGEPTPAAARASGRAAYWQLTLRAVGAIAVGRLTGAVKLLHRARKRVKKPRQLHCDLLVGLAALAGGRAQQARRLFDRVIAGGATGSQVFYWAARAELAAGRIGPAFRRIEQALALGTKDPAVLVARAVLGVGIGQRRGLVAPLAGAARQRPNLLDPTLLPSPAVGAVAYLETALRGIPQRAKVWRTQGHLYWRTGAVLAAERRFRALLARDARDGDAMQMIARCLHAKGQAKAALGRAKRAVELAPDLAAARATYGELLLASGDARRAVPQLKKAANARPRDAGLLSRLGRACADAEKPDCALKFARYAARRNPRSAEAVFGLARALAHKGKRRAARGAYERAMRLDPTDPRIPRAAAHLARLAGDRRRARSLLARSRRIERSRRRFDRRTRRAVREISAMVAALAACKKVGRVCSRALSRLSLPTRSWLRASQALRRGRNAGARRWLAKVVPYLHPRLLLSKQLFEISMLIHVGRGVRAKVRKRLPMIAVTQLRRVAIRKNPKNKTK